MRGQGLSLKGFAFQDEQAYKCRMVSAIDASDTKGEDSIEETSDNHPLKDIKFEDAPKPTFLSARR